MKRLSFGRARPDAEYADRMKATAVGRAQGATELVADEEAVRERDEASGSRFLNRELSWLDFNERVLALAEDDSRPALERAKFLAIFSRNLDEFFQIRVSGLREQGDRGCARLAVWDEAARAA
jgi:hypothetical protein